MLIVATLTVVLAMLVFGVSRLALTLVDSKPSPPPNSIPPHVEAALWAEAGDDGTSMAERGGLVGASFRLLCLSRASSASEISECERRFPHLDFAWRVAAWHLAREGSEMRGWKRQLATFALSDWIVRNWSNTQLVAYVAEANFYGREWYGVAAAAAGYFDKPPDELGAEEAALLAAISASPSRLDPVCHPDEALIRRNQVLTQMAGRKSIHGRVDELLALPLVVNESLRCDHARLLDTAL